jgi:RNA polymerase sigma factor (sigma-70 family)
MATQPPIDCQSLSDRALLRLFLQTGSDEAFRQLVDRHAALVLGTCRRGLHSQADADDAFQATFLVLARSASKIRRRDALAAWLYGVATRICLRMRRDAARRSTQELMDTPAEHVDPLDELLARHDEMVADEELTALPSSLRTPLVLRYLAGKCNAEVAAELGITIAALEGRLKRGKQQLRMRLLRRGVTLAAVVATLKATRVAASEVPSQLAETAIEAALSSTSGTISALASESTTSTHFALQELSAMHASLVTKPVVAALGVSGLAAAVLTAQIAFSQGDAGNGGGSFALDASAMARPADDPQPSTLAANGEETDPFASESGQGPNTNGDDPFADPTVITPQRSKETTQAPAVHTANGDKSGTPTIVDLKSRSRSEIAIETALTTPLRNVGLQFQGAPLSEVVDFLRSEYDIEIAIDAPALDDLGISPDDGIDVNLRNISLESALNLMLRQLDLTFIIENEVLLITSEEEALTRMETRVYPMPKSSDLDIDSLTQMLTRVIAPDSWVENGGGEGDIAFVGDKVVIRQTYEVHRQINELLWQLQSDTEEGISAKTLRDAEIGKADYPTGAELKAPEAPQVFPRF